MIHLPRLRREDTVLLVVDVQDKLLNVMMEGERIGNNCALLTRAARLLDIPVIVTEQNPTKLGATVPVLAQALGTFDPIAKMKFSACVPEVVEQLAAMLHRTVLLVGIEAHVCVLQTALDLLESGHTVFIAADAISSRQEWTRRAAWERMRLAGAVPTSTESAIFELLGEAGTPEFRAMLPLVR